MKKVQLLFAGVLGLLAVLVLAGVAYLTLIFPKTAVAWTDEGRVLSVAEKTLADLSSMCKSSGLVLVPVLILILVGCAVWALRAATQTDQESATPPVDATCR